MGFIKAIFSLCALYLVFWLARAIYRLFFHPLAGYPGSIVAAVSAPWYEWYWNFYHKGELLFEIERQHQKHGPIIRIAPNDLHINDPEIFQDITKVGSKFIKDPKFYNFITFPNTSIGYTDPTGHRIRRQVLTPAFSPARVQELIPMIQGKVDKLMKRLEGFAKSKTPVNINASTNSFTMDIVSKIVLGQEVGCLDDPTFKNQFIDYLHAAFEMGWTATAFPNMTIFSFMLPKWLSKILFPIPIMILREQCVELVKEYQAKGNAISEDKKSVVIDMLVDPNSAKDHSVLTPDQLGDEVIMLLTAGNDTTSLAMIIGIYQICRNPDVYKRLEEELHSAFPSLADGIRYETAKNLPYLNATIKEILRISSPLPGRLPRLVPPEGYQMYGKHVPGGTALNTSIFLLNRHPAIWTDPDKFDPDRWLAPGASNLDKYLTSFQRGTRQCLGKDLAWMEFYLLLSNLFRRFHLTIHETTDADMEWMDLLLIYFKGRNFHAMLEQKTA